MAQRTVLIDDIDGSDADETIVFTFDNVTYTIDLNEKNAAKFRSAMEKWINSADQVEVERPRRSPNRHTAAERVSSAEERVLIRQWAIDNGYQVSERGRIPISVEQAYREAQR